MQYTRYIEAYKYVQGTTSWIASTDKYSLIGRRDSDSMAKPKTTDQY